MSGFHPISISSSWIVRSSFTHVVVMSVAIGFAMFLVPSVLELWRWKHGFSLTSTVLISNALMGTMVAALHFLFITSMRHRRAMLLQRLQVIAELNHHVRNALEAIEMAASVSSVCDGEQQKVMLEIIRQSTGRIAWALQEVLGPGIREA